jgi:hypothetical protein
VLDQSANLLTCKLAAGPDVCVLQWSADPSTLAVTAHNGDNYTASLCKSNHIASAHKTNGTVQGYPKKPN